MYLIQEGNAYNVAVKNFYVESDEEISLIPPGVPEGTIVEVNEPGNFHVKMKASNGEWNLL